MGAVSQIIQPISTLVSNVVQDTSNALTGALQPVEKAINQGVTNLGKTIANNPALEGAITAIGAAYGVPPAATAAFLAANKTSQTGGNLEKGLETLVLSYGAGKFMAPGGIDLSSPAAIDQSVTQAQTAAQTAAAAPSAALPMGGSLTPIANLATVAPSVPASTAAGTSLSNLAAMDAGGKALSTAVGGAGVAPAALTPAAIESAIGTSGYGFNASAEAALNAAGANPAIVGTGSLIGAPSLNAAQTALTGALATPVAGISANEAVASGMGPGSVGAQQAATGGLTAEQLAAAAGTTGAGSALNALATAGNANALTDLLNSGSSGIGNLLNQAGNAIGNTVSGLSGTQLAALGTGAAGLYNASATRQAMQDALAAQEGFTNASTKTVTDLYNKSLGYNAPYQALGAQAAGEISNEMPYLTHQFDVTDLYKGLAPNYNFMLQQGQQANLRAANVGGGMLGGNAQTGLNKFTQDYAGSAYQNAFNNFQNQRTGIYNNLANIAGIGQTANTAMGTAGTTLSNNIVGLNTNLSNAQAANILGQAQVGAGGVTNAANTAFLATLLGQNTPTAGAAPTTGGTSGYSLSDIAKLASTIGGGVKSLFG